MPEYPAEHAFYRDPMAARSNVKGKRKATNSFKLYRQGRTTPQIRLTIFLVLIARRWRSLLDERLRPIDQSSARMEALSAILNLPPLRAQVEIAKRLRIEGPTITRMLDVLEKDKLVSRLPDPKDRRTNLLELTPEGIDALQDIFEITDTLRARLLDGFSDEQIATINEFFEVLMARLDAGLPDPE